VSLWEREVTSEEWVAIQSSVTDAMLAHTTPFGTPLGTASDTSVRLIGSGAYVTREDRRLLVTCEHVARETPIHYRFHGSDNVFEHREIWTMDPPPIDAACTVINDNAWMSSDHSAAAIRYERFATCHKIVEPAELLFFRGYAGENAHYAFGVHETNASGYCTQEKKGTGDQEIFELLWEPQHTEFTSGTTSQAKSAVRFDDARGFSGSLVWNTRYLEVTKTGRSWSPDDAVVTGLLRRWDQQTKTLLVWRVEHLKRWLES
tara:strand:- start:5867 stop:6649 length:783 start_codon:yes stop_codon:yes gene_type:complete